VPLQLGQPIEVQLERRSAGNPDVYHEALRAIEPQVAALLKEHRARSVRWMPHEVVPWGRGVDFIEKPWSEEQCSLRPEVALALETNLLTEDNLPYFHFAIASRLEPGGIWQEWSRLWTAEEATHAAAMRDYLHLMRVVDPAKLERNRLQFMQQGFDREFSNPLEIFAYTSAQELATRVSHQRTGQRADEPVILKLMNLISRDENFHYLFYRGIVEELLEIVPELMLPAIQRQLYSFEMPGTKMDRFELRMASIANAGIYGAREHRDCVIKPVLNFWEIDKITGLTPETQKIQERILKLEKLLDRLVERQDSRRPTTLH
jgi:acyl-[acyl-carrier-protein] desaturase